MPTKDITGNKYGLLTAVSMLERSNNGDRYWLCNCECGGSKKSTVGRLNFGSVNHCGCKSFSLHSAIRKTHGMSKGKEYKSWTKMKERCFSETCQDYKDYGAIGISMQDSWKISFLEFYLHIGPQPDDGLKYTVDRIDNNLGYFEGNVRWATNYLQARNKGKQTNNTSGTTAVNWDNKQHPAPNENKYSLYAKAACRINGKIKSRCFSVSKYGLLPAFAMACAERENMIIQLNLSGAGYSANHGK